MENKESELNLESGLNSQLSERNFETIESGENSAESNSHLIEQDAGPQMAEKIGEILDLSHEGGPEMATRQGVLEKSPTQVVQTSVELLLVGNPGESRTDRAVVNALNSALGLDRAA